MAISVNVTETVVNTDVTNTDITVALTEQTTNVELTYPGPQGASAIVNVITPITNTGTTTEPNIGIDQTLLSLARTQIVGTAVTEAAGKALTAGTADYATLAGTAVNISGTIAPTQVTGTAAILGTNTFTGQQTITPATSVTGLTINAASNAVGLIVKLGASGSSDLTQWQDNAGTTNVARITNTGFFHGRGLRIKNGTATTSGVQASIEPEGTTVVGLLIRGIASQTANLQEWQDSGSAVRASVSSAGAFTISPSAGTALTVNAASSASASVGIIVKANTGGGGGNVAEFYNESGNLSTYINASNQLGIRTGGSSYSAALAVNTGNTTIIGQAIRGASSQTADLTQWQATGGTVLGGRNAVGQLWSGSTAPVTVATGGAISGTSSGTTATLTSASAHGLAVGDLVTIAGMTPSGYNGTYLVATVPTTTTFTVTTSGSNLGNSTVSGTASVPAQASITARSAGTVGLVVRAAASQTARVVDVYDSTPTRIASIDGSGNIRGNQLRTNNDLGLMGELSTGSYLTLYTMSANTPAVPGAGYGRLYLKTGTNANTLKLCIRAGAAGAETTILDNIPT